MKPSWDDAPEWAEYLAMDKDGNWFWHEYRPERNTIEWDSGAGMVQIGDEERPDWTKTLEPRQ